MIMDREYLLKVIEQKFFVLDKEQIAQKVENNISFAQSQLTPLFQKQDPKLDDTRLHKYLHACFFDVFQKFKQNLEKARSIKSLADSADTAVLIISIYYHYPQICTPLLMFEILHEIFRSKLLFTY